MTKGNIYTGMLGEGAVCEYLSSQGYTVISRNFRAAHGEIDIIAKEGDRTVFVEVKTRTSAFSKYGRPSNAVTLKKRQNFVSAVKEYQRLHKESEKCRIDVIEVYLINGNAEIKHIKSAFGNV
jgi:putative endonuclease